MSQIVKKLKPDPDTSKQWAGSTIYLHGYFMLGPTAQMFKQRGFELVEMPEVADFICFVGGDDVSPSLYNQKRLSCTYPDHSLDLTQVSIFKRARQDAVKIGICRGGQLLCVLNGGSMWQDLDNHNDGGTHTTTDVITGEVLNLNSLHHQAMILPPKGGELIAVASAATYKENAYGKWTSGVGMSEPDIEAAWFPATKSLCFQPHPEFPHVETREYFFNLLERFVPPF